MKPLIRQGLEEFKQASKSADHVDITRQEVTSEELRQAADQPAGNDYSGEPVKSVVLPPLAEETASASAAEVKILEPSEEETRGELADIQADVDMHFEPGESSTTQGEKRKEEKTPTPVERHLSA